MSTSTQSTTWQQTELETPSNKSDQTPPAYSETRTSQDSLPSYSKNLESGSSRRRKSSSVRSALLSFVKGDVFQYHPALVQERYQEIEERVKAQSAKKT